MKVLVTGGAGYIGSTLIQSLLETHPDWFILATDIKPMNLELKSPQFEFQILDISDRNAVIDLIQSWNPNSIVHLASILNPPPGMSEEIQWKIDVHGTKNVLDGAVYSKTEQVIITSSGAAYGYHKENKEWIEETDPIRGHSAFVYSKHKREVEELLAEYRTVFPELKQLILRPGTILGKTVNNLITDMFQKPFVMGILGHKSPFVFIWDEDVIAIIAKGISEKKEGIFNLAGDGALSLKEISQMIRKPYVPIPSLFLQSILWVLRLLRLTQYGPDQIDFLRYRPVLSNHQLKSVFGYNPKYTSKETFIAYLNAKGVPYVEI
ncbi:NAD-dependent epimerase/dehydratase family protein [Leptospira biflexa]|uniref:NAD-dependent epimerase/dehydratase family protein n=1 Tax=Leptospira biflexa TaxID=172 RepID=UPI001084823D|nr:NAD-dependent epimerase/dehydratase family protein [Leptospira biflexa]TGM37602.1 NAD-dependent epimerase/dehydratase family protein [Leptospira biflexa]TGM40938.1 NAD-dependent epimerase/dehydratase family protein [Leptospira biflexa]TGM47140.1 NAD-dependent epimerase/dehydratase family protein [Leptospira biflexa]TGM50395.1 NAD-dependent epimerase/dehydratase family protein [Leptospira biflexa]